MSKKFSVPTAAKTPLILYGRHAVTAALANPERKIAKLLCTAENAPEAKKICAARGLPEAAVNIVDRREIDRILPRDAVHQGFVLLPGDVLMEDEGSNGQRSEDTENAPERVSHTQGNFQNHAAHAEEGEENSGDGQKPHFQRLNPWERTRAEIATMSVATAPKSQSMAMMSSCRRLMSGMVTLPSPVRFCPG